ncbi:MAG: hypothetical protein V1863_05175 [Candidatus Omnitrophota bacterium]
MDNFVFALKDQIYQTIVLMEKFLKTVHWPQVGFIVATAFILVMRHWPLRKIFSFFLTCLIFLILLVRIEASIITRFGQEGSTYGVLVGRFVYMALAAVIFIYHAAIKE